MKFQLTGDTLHLEWEDGHIEPEWMQEAFEEVAEDPLSTLSLFSQLEPKYDHSGDPLPDPEEGMERENQGEVELSIEAMFAHDIHNRRAQGILNKALEGVRGITRSARKDLQNAIKRGGRDGGADILKFVDRYRSRLSSMLSTTQLAALLEGARDVAKTVPTLADFPGTVPPPPSLEPTEAIALVNKLEKVTGEARAKVIYDLPPDQQQYIEQALAAKEATSPLISPPLSAPPAPAASAPEGVHFPTIDESARLLSEKNLMDRRRFDALDAASRAKAFTVSGVEAEHTLGKIRDALAENVREGADYREFQKKVMDQVEEGSFLSDAHQETVFRTNIQSAFSDGQQQVLSHPLVRTGFPYSSYNAIHDDRVRENHLALEKLGIGGTNIYRNDDPVFQTFRPPWDYNDRCGWTPLTIRQAAEKGVKEAQDWVETGEEPHPPAYVPMPSFRPPEGFQRGIESAPLSIQLSIRPISAYMTMDEQGHEHAAAGTGKGGQFVSKGQGGGGSSSGGGQSKPQFQGPSAIPHSWKDEHAPESLVEGAFRTKQYLQENDDVALEIIKAYTSEDYESPHSYVQLNQNLRKQPNGTGLDASQKESVMKLQKLASAPLPEPVTSYRGVKAVVANTLLKDAKVGATLSFNGFNSTSLNPQVAREFGAVVMEIKAKTGFYADPMSAAYEEAGEQENELIQRHGIHYRVAEIRTSPKTGAVIGLLMEEV